MRCHLQTDQIVSLTDRDGVLNQMIATSIAQAIEQGADLQTTRLVDLQIIPYHYIPGNFARVIATTSGTQSLHLG